MGNQTQSVLILDIGGHEGFTTFPSLVCMPIHHRVITVEPVFENQETLNENGRRFGLNEASFQWRMIRGAFSNVTSETDIYVPTQRTDNTALNNVASTLNVGGKARRERINLYRGDEVIFDAGVRPAIIKMDVQGAELLVMRGFEKMLSAPLDLVVMAEHDSRLMQQYGVQPGEPTQFMIDHGFTTYCAPDMFSSKGVFYVRNDSTVLTAFDVATNSNNVMQGCEDLVFVKNINANPAL